MESSKAGSSECGSGAEVSSFPPNSQSLSSEIVREAGPRFPGTLRPPESHPPRMGNEVTVAVAAQLRRNTLRETAAEKLISLGNNYLLDNYGESEPEAAQNDDSFFLTRDADD